MKNILCAIILIGLCSCATQHKPISGLQYWSFHQSQFDPTFNFSYADHVLELSGNKRAERWAKRKNIQVLAVRIINNTDNPIHGTQLLFYNNSEQIEVLQNEWLARKIRQRISPMMILTLPAVLIESAFWNKVEETEDDQILQNNISDHSLLSTKIANQEEKRRERANFNLTEELKRFQVNSQIYRPGKPVFGIVGLKSKQPLNKLQIHKRTSNLQIVSTPITN